MTLSMWDRPVSFFAAGANPGVLSGACLLGSSLLPEPGSCFGERGTCVLGTFPPLGFCCCLGEPGLTESAGYELLAEGLLDTL